MTQWTGWLELVAEEVVLAAALLVVFDGCRRFAREGFSRRASLLLLLGALVPVVDARLNFHVIDSMAQLQAEKVSAVALHGREPAGGWEKAASAPEARSALSLQAATVAYMFEGRRIEVLDTSGARIAFVPTADQEHAREQFVRDEKGAEDTARSSFEHGLRVSIGLLSFMLAGAAVGWRQRRRA